jgi:hypothetical protein
MPEFSWANAAYTTSTLFTEHAAVDPASITPLRSIQHVVLLQAMQRGTYTTVGPSQYVCSTRERVKEVHERRIFHVVPIVFKCMQNYALS